ncbi:hypothetical protein [Sphingomonas bacterium]|uniref:hypothetical protein n=1 Tax=Sphingomonas bacterium TaxID=1895847 RepID=UPI001575DC60|nr:hypothetical protein [Sphingomonas bacterium]
MSVVRPAAGLATGHPLPPLPEGRQAVGRSVLTEGTLAMLVTDVDLQGEHRRVNDAWRSSIPPDPPARLWELAANGVGRLLLARPKEWDEGASFPLETPFPLCDRFSDGRWLIVKSRARDATNARVLSPEGALVQRFRLGDGIEHVAIDADDRIWVGWFDEGVVGNDNWRLPGHDWAPSSNGVACFAADGPLLSLPDWPDGTSIIADCYAQNVTGSGAWVCPYTEFPLVCFEPDHPTRWWRSDVAGAKAIAVDGRHALLAGGYREDAARLALVELAGEGDGEQASLLATWIMPLRRLPPPSNDWAPVWDAPDLLVGRGGVLHLIVDHRWYRWHVETVVAAWRRDQSPTG